MFKNKRTIAWWFVFGTIKLASYKFKIGNLMIQEWIFFEKVTQMEVSDMNWSVT